jgi:hypothetical protein
MFPFVPAVLIKLRTLPKELSTLDMEVAMELTDDWIELMAVVILL